MMRFAILMAALVAFAVTGHAQNEWKTIGSWSGSGNIKEGESFTTSKREWRIRWTAKPTGSVSLFQIYVKRAEDGGLVSAISAGDGETAGESYVRSLGRHYLAFNTSGVAWTAVAEEPAK